MPTAPQRWSSPSARSPIATASPVLAEIKGHATHSQEPQWFTTAPIPAIRKLLDKVGWSVGDVDLFEINEAFAVVAMAARCAISAFRATSSTSTAAPARSAIPSAPPARA